MPRVPVLGLPTYGLVVVAGFVVALLLVRGMARRAGLPVALVQDVVLHGVLFGLLGAKVALIVVDPRVLAAPLELLVQAGVFYGGLIAGLAGATWRVARLGLDFHQVGDCCAPGLAVAQAIGRVGCFLAGCCWGRACDVPWGVRLHESAAAHAGWGGIPLHPVQLYEAAGLAAIAVLAWGVAARSRRPGFGWWSYVAAHGALRLVTEQFRGDPRGTWLGGRVTTSEVLAAAALVAGVVMLAVRLRSGRAANGGGGDAPDAQPGDGRSATA